LEKEAVAIKKEALKICWYMRGMSYEEAMTLSYEERSLVGEIIKDNLETTKKSRLPFF
jgi:GTP cyclohydrolase I